MSVNCPAIQRGELEVDRAAVLVAFRIGDHPEHLTALVGEDDRRAVVIANALDDAPADVRRSGAERELAALAGLGFDAAELDLRDYFGQDQRLGQDLGGTALAWLRGGNAFMLCYALYRSGGDAALGDLLAGDALVYAGYSAAGCVLSPSLRGLELVDDADAVWRVLWRAAGLGRPGAGQRGVRPALPGTGPSRDSRNGACCGPIPRRSSRLPYPARRAGPPHRRPVRRDRIAAPTGPVSVHDWRQKRMGLAAALRASGLYRLRSRRI